MICVPWLWYVCDQCVDRHGRRFVGLIRHRYVVVGGHNLVCLFSILPLPDSRYVKPRVRAPQVDVMRL